MRRFFASAALLLLAPLCRCPRVHAQSIPMGFDVFAEFGPSCLHGQVHSGASGNVRCETGRFFTGARLRLSRHDAFEASYSYSPNIFSYTPYFYPGLPPVSYQNNRLHSYSLNYVRYLATYPHVQPFVTGGVGSEHFQGRIVYPSNPFIPSGGSQFAWNYGAGIDVIPQRHFALRLELRDYLATVPFYPATRLHNIVPSVGIVFRFHRDRKL